MSENVKEAAQQAYNTIVEQLAAPYFFEKLSAAGISPANEAEAGELWVAAQKLHALYTAEQQKTAAARQSGFTALNQQLDQLLEAQGFGGSTEKQATLNNVASLAAAQPDIANAVLTLQTAAYAAAQAEE